MQRAWRWAWKIRAAIRLDDASPEQLWSSEQSDHYDFVNRLGSLGDDDLCGSSFQSHRASSNSQDTRAFIPRADRRCPDSGICSCLLSKGCDLFHDGVLAGDRNDQLTRAGKIAFNEASIKDKK